MDGFEAIIKRVKDRDEGFVFGTGKELRSKGEEKGNLEGELVFISAIKNTI